MLCYRLAFENKTTNEYTAYIFRKTYYTSKLTSLVLKHMNILTEGSIETVLKYTNYNKLYRYISK